MHKKKALLSLKREEDDIDNTITNTGTDKSCVYISGAPYLSSDEEDDMFVGGS